MPRPYQLEARQTSKTGSATVSHDFGLHPVPIIQDPLSTETLRVGRKKYTGRMRPHYRDKNGQPNATKQVTMTIAGLITLERNTEVVVQARKKTNGDWPPPNPPAKPAPTTAVLIARTTDEENYRLFVFCKEVSVPKGHDIRKANSSKLRRNIRDKGTAQQKTFYVWTRDQYRFTIKRAAD